MILIADLKRAQRIIERKKTRGRWPEAVRQDALNLIDWLLTEAEHTGVFKDKDALHKALLNGAQDWKQYSFGCGSVADCDNLRLATRYASESGLKNLRYKEGGVRNPKTGGTWLDVQAKALAQAEQLIFDNLHRTTYKNIRKEGRLWAMDITGAEYTSTVYARLKSDLTREIKKRGYIPAETL